MNREQWLQGAVRKLRPMFKAVDAELPKDIQVSCSFPAGSYRKIRGQCWSARAGQGVPQIFMSPLYDEPVLILTILLHELIHAWDDCESGHKGAFIVKGKALGLVAPWTTATPTDELTAKLTAIAEKLGPYPHKAIDPGAAGGKKQTTRMLKAVCDVDGYTVRLTKKWIEELGMPSCPCGTTLEMEEAS